MVSERLRDFLLSWCNPDAQPEEVATMLHSEGGAYYADWLEGEMLAAARSGDFAPKSLERLTGLWFPGERDVEQWLREVWPMWFARPYPG